MSSRLPVFLGLVPGRSLPLPVGNASDALLDLVTEPSLSYVVRSDAADALYTGLQVGTLPIPARHPGVERPRDVLAVWRGLRVERPAGSLRIPGRATEIL